MKTQAINLHLTLPLDIRVAVPSVEMKARRMMAELPQKVCTSLIHSNCCIKSVTGRDGSDFNILPLALLRKRGSCTRVENEVAVSPMTDVHLGSARVVKRCSWEEPSEQMGFVSR